MLEASRILIGSILFGVSSTNLATWLSLGTEPLLATDPEELEARLESKRQEATFFP